MTKTKVVKKGYRSHASVGLWHVITKQGAAFTNYLAILEIKIE